MAIAPGGSPPLIVRTRASTRILTGLALVVGTAMVLAGVTGGAPAAVVVGGLVGATSLATAIANRRSRIRVDGPVLTLLTARGGATRVRLDRTRAVRRERFGTRGSNAMTLQLTDADGNAIRLHAMRFRLAEVAAVVAPWCLDDPGVQWGDGDRRWVAAHGRRAGTAPVSHQ